MVLQEASCDPTAFAPPGASQRGRTYSPITHDRFAVSRGAGPGVVATAEELHEAVPDRYTAREHHFHVA